VPVARQARSVSTGRAGGEQLLGDHAADARISRGDLGARSALRSGEGPGYRNHHRLASIQRLSCTTIWRRLAHHPLTALISMPILLNEGAINRSAEDTLGPKR
jgi:hypothetical protein